MEYFVLSTFGLGLSLCLNAYFLFKHFSKSQRQLTADARALLAELSRGKAVIEVRVLDAAGLFYRSPRG